MNFNVEDYEVVFSVIDNNPVTSNERVLMRKINDNTTMYMKLSKEAEKAYGLIRKSIPVATPQAPSTSWRDTRTPAPSSSPIHGPVAVPTSAHASVVVSPPKACWDRNASLMLIHLYDEHKENIHSSIQTKDKAWEVLANKMREQGFIYTGPQCRDKFKYLRMRYVKKKDNMRKDKNSGAEAIKCEFFDELEAIFGKKPNVEPLSIASSSRGACNISEHETTDVEPAKKKKRNTFDFEMLAAERETAREKRHVEQMAMHQKAIDSYNFMMSEFLKKL